MTPYVVGVDAGGTTTRAVAVDKTMRINALHARRALCLSVATVCLPQLPVTPLLPLPAYAAAELSDEQSLIVEAWAEV